MKGEPLNETALSEFYGMVDGPGVTKHKMRGALEADPHGRDPHAAGSKLDAGKLHIVTHFLHYFPRACAAVTEVSDYGAQKYTSRGWVDVPNGFERYSDALGRHLIAEGYESHDADSKLSHAAQVAWNALARLELMLQGEEKGWEAGG